MRARRDDGGRVEADDNDGVCGGLARGGEKGGGPRREVDASDSDDERSAAVRGAGLEEAAKG